MTRDRDSLSFGQYLRDVRLERQISLEEVSTLTRIGLPSLLTIEQEDIERLPDEVFVKGFIRSFAWAIGADGDDAVRRYELYYTLMPFKKPLDRKILWAGRSAEGCGSWLYQQYC